MKKLFLACLTGIAMISMQPYVYAVDVPQVHSTSYRSSSSMSFNFSAVISVSLGVAAVLTSAAAFGSYVGWQVISQAGKEEFTPEEKQHSKVAYVFANGLGNPRFRCAVAIPNSLASFLTPKMLLLQYPHYFDGRFFAMHPKHVFAKRSGDDQAYVDAVAARQDIEKIIRVGHSCGASDAIVDLCMHEQSEKLKGVIAISPFAHTDDIINNWWVARIPGINAIARAAAVWTLKKFNGHQPIDKIKEASAKAKETPVCIVASTGDWTVPSSSSERLAQAMRDAEFKDVTFVCHDNWMAGHDLAFVGNDTTETDAWTERVLAEDKSTDAA